MTVRNITRPSMFAIMRASRIAPLMVVALCGCLGMLSLPPIAQGSRVSGTQVTSGRCTPASSERARDYVDFYRRTVAAVDEPLWEAYRGDLRLSTPLDSTQVVAETADSVCAAAHALYATQFRTSSLDRMIVIKLDTVRAIIRDRYQAATATTITTSASPHLITNAPFTTVIDTIWY